jgi:hypothetical protein
MVDASCGDTFMMKSENDARTLFENLGENSLHRASSSRRAPAPKAQKDEGLFEASSPLDITTKVDALSRKFDQLMAADFARTTSHTPTPHEPCSFCSSPMQNARDCPTLGQFFNITNEQVSAAFSRLGNDQYSNSYNPGWKTILTPWRESKLLEILLRNLMECTIKLISIPTNFHPTTGLPNTNTNQFHLLLGTLPLRIKCYLL